MIDDQMSEANAEIEQSENGEDEVTIFKTGEGFIVRFSGEDTSVAALDEAIEVIKQHLGDGDSEESLNKLFQGAMHEGRAERTY